MSKKGENIYKRKDGRWEGRYVKEKDGGKVKYGYVYAKTYRQAKDKMLGISGMPYAESCSVVFDAAAEEWFESCKKRLKTSSLAKYRNILDNHLLPEFGGMGISSITRSRADDFCSRLLKSGGKNGNGLSAKTVSAILMVLKNILYFSSERYGIGVHSLNGIYIKQSVSETPVLGAVQQKKLLGRLFNDLNSHSLGIVICMFTGMRIGEICALKWKNILLDEKIIIVEKTMQRIQLFDGGEKKTKIMISEPKSSSSVRKIPIPQSIYPYIKSMKKSDEAYVLTSSETRFTEPRSLQNKFKRLLNDCGIEYVNFHSLRHTFATNCIELGFDPKSLSEILGHSGVNITLNRYVHPSMSLKRKNMDMIDL